MSSRVKRSYRDGIQYLSRYGDDFVLWRSRSVVRRILHLRSLHATNQMSFSRRRSSGRGDAHTSGYLAVERQLKAGLWAGAEAVRMFVTRPDMARESVHTTPSGGFSVVQWAATVTDLP